MSLFALLFAAGMFALPLHRSFWLKPFALLAIAAGIVFVDAGSSAVLLQGFVQSGVSDFFFTVLLVVLGAFVLSEDMPINIIQALFLGAASVLLLQSATLLTFIFSFEALSVVSFAVVGAIRSGLQAEAAVKMFLSGAIATGLVMLGIALFTFGGGDINAPLSLKSVNSFETGGLWIVLLGIFYKLTIVPMHAWAAQGYSGMKPSSAALLSGIAKTVVVLGVFVFFKPFFAVSASLSVPLLIIISLVTMTLGNVLALFQRKVAKILAYSSIAQAGYILIVFSAYKSGYAPYGVLYMAVAYIFMQTALFLLVDRIGGGVSDLLLEEMKGLGREHRLAALFFTVQLFSLAGVPLLAGFLGKTVGVYALVDAGHIWPALWVLLNSTLAVGYYAWIVKHLYFDAPDQTARIVALNGMAKAAQVILLVGTLFFGVFAYSVFAVKF
jgi:NADH:ubiquinone oxidoreductase subunit 2 (subunit N)